ncbi:MAG TPA: serine hydrolase, partial [Vicinamibacterales bacterium]|nr:serine hydrolase [Vicinamibacterales bacterium]
GPDARADTRAVLRAATAARLEAIAAQVDGVIGYAIGDVEPGESFTRLPDEVFPAASTIKLAILYELFRQADEGRVSLDERRPLDRRHAVGGSGVLGLLGTPALSLRDCATLMVVLSDNTATNVIIDAVGLEAVDRRLSALGLTRTRLRRRMMDLEAARRGDENVSTPGELAALLRLLHKGEGLSAASHRALLDILALPKSSALRRRLPPEVRVADKPGSLDGIRVEAGIVYAAGRPYVFAAMGAWLADGEAAERALAEASAVAFSYFDRLGASSDLGRRIAR